MFIIFDEKGKEIRKYSTNTLTDEIKKHRYIELKESDIPYKDGFYPIARLENDILKWDYIEVDKSPEEHIEKLYKDYDILSDTLAVVLDVLLEN